MCTGNSVQHHESGTVGGMIRPFTASSLCATPKGVDFFKGTSSPADAGDGVSTYLALIFGTLLSSQGTDASFVLTRRTFSGAFLRALPFGLAVSRFRLYQIVLTQFPRFDACLKGVAFALLCGEIKLYQSFFGLLATPCRHAEAQFAIRLGLDRCCRGVGRSCASAVTQAGVRQYIRPELPCKSFARGPYVRQPGPLVGNRDFL